ncbi:MAG TPA: DUF547 domain-containing protein [Sedimenticola thiotaurini]|uniref:DUF547 domain-containing protein n=1 Tax=Sedimenticola thiotaurini TaxID=1543721 RepID=A0A831W752_9GAMM|nr:DUF547 domain-containing protein [Sedimenticola thiotaurini]
MTARLRPLLLLLLLTTAIAAAAAPKAELWQYWLPSATVAETGVDHTPWQRFLDRRLHKGADGISRVDYGGVTAGERAGLAAYLEQLQRIRPARLTRPQQLAFWINLYNAGTLQLILDHYPVASIRDIDISPGLFSDGPWGRKLFRIDGQALSLDDIEHRILRPIWNDNRIHYAVNCASVGCPNLQPRAFTAANAGRLLEQAAREYINHPRGARVEDGRLYVSSIYRWFQEDFGASEAGVIRHLRRYANAPLRRQLEGIDGIADDDYDWSLNDLR